MKSIQLFLKKVPKLNLLKVGGTVVVSGTLFGLKNVVNGLSLIKKLSEHQEQTTIFKWASIYESKYPELKYMFATLNGVKLNIGQARKAKASGNKRGVPDIVFPFPNGKYNGLFIELKVGKNKPSIEQLDYIEFLKGGNFYASVCYGSNEAIDLIVDYLEGLL
jgi:hypothetical protein